MVKVKKIKLVLIIPTLFLSFSATASVNLGAGLLEQAQAQLQIQVEDPATTFADWYEVLPDGELRLVCTSKNNTSPDGPACDEDQELIVERAWQSTKDSKETQLEALDPMSAYGYACAIGFGIGAISGLLGGFLDVVDNTTDFSDVPYNRALLAGGMLAGMHALNQFQNGAKMAAALKAGGIFGAAVAGCMIPGQQGAYHLFIFTIDSMKVKN